MADPLAPPAVSTVGQASPSNAPEASWVADTLAGHVGPPVHVRWLEQRAACDVFVADTPAGPLLLKVGAAPALTREAGNLRQARAAVGDLAPGLVGLFELGGGRALLAMAHVPGEPLQPWRLSPAAWRHLTRGLLQLHSQLAGEVATCIPLTADFITVGPSVRVGLADFRRRLATVVHGHPAALGAAPPLLEALHNVVAASMATFEVRPRLIHGDVWPDNVLVRGSRCWLVDWAWLSASDYALDLANLKLMLDWVWPIWLGHVAFERLVRQYAVTFADPGLTRRLSVYLPLVSLVHLVQYGEAGSDDPYNAAAMRACLVTAQFDFAVWRQPQAVRRIARALGRPGASEYAPPPLPRASWPARAPRRRG